jgi:hypothetical protein
MPQRYWMNGTKCSVCGTHFFPPRHFCPKCRRKGKIEEHRMKGKGQVYSYTVIRSPQQGFELENPYVMAIVQLYEGPKLTAQLCDVNQDEVKVGMPVKMVFRKISEDGESGIIHYGYKFTKDERVAKTKE